MANSRDNNNHRPRGAGGGRAKGRRRGRGSYNHEHYFAVQERFGISISDPASRIGASLLDGSGGLSSGPNSGRNTPGGRGCGRGSNQYSPGGPSFQRSRGNGRKLNPNAPLSTILYESRPFLKPITFVSSIHTRTLFEQNEDILQTTVHDVVKNEENDIPTAHRIARVFSASGMLNWQSEDGSSSGGLEEIDFEDMEKFCQKTNGLAVSNDSPQHRQIAPAVKEIALLEPESHANISSDSMGPIVNEGSLKAPIVEEKLIPLLPITTKVDGEFIAVQRNSNIAETVVSTPIDVNPSPAGSTSTQATLSSTAVHKEIALLNQRHVEEDDEDIIVYVAPHPRIHTTIQPSSDKSSTSLFEISAKPTTPQEVAPSVSERRPSEAVQPAAAARPIPPPPLFESVTFSFANSPIPPKQLQYRPTYDSASQTKARIKARSKEKASRRKQRERQTMFSMLGAIVSETQVRAEGPEKDPRRDEQRREDSDVDWGDEQDDAVDATEAVEPESQKDVGAMDVDPELEISIDQMKTFVNWMTHGEIHFVTMDDVADEEKLRQEDEAERDERGSSGDEEIDAVVNEEEIAMIGEPNDAEVVEDLMENEESEEEDSSDEELSPRAGFRARLERLRRNDGGKGKAAMRSISRDVDPSEDDDDFSATQATKTENFIAGLEDLLDQESDFVHSRDRKARIKIFQAIENGYFDGLRDIGSAGGRNQEQQILSPKWEKVRVTKAEKRRLRRQALLEQAADPFSIKKSGKKSRKLIRAAAQLSPSNQIPNRIFSVGTLVEQIRRFVDDIGGPQSMTMPPMDKFERKMVHEIAQTFNLTSKSKGFGADRYTTIWRTSRTGTNIDGRKIARFIGSRDELLSVVKKNKGTRNARPKEGDEVGKAAPKIDKSNVGFRMLQLMGWSEGDRIGISGGLDAPLVAVIKNTKLGLGANR